MAAKKQTVADTHELVILPGQQNLCDHCGTVAHALTTWPDEMHHECPCTCHMAYLYDKGRKKRGRGK